MEYYEDVGKAPEYLQEMVKLVGFDYGQFSCVREASDGEIFKIISLLQVELANRNNYNRG